MAVPLAARAGLAGLESRGGSPVAGCPAPATPPHPNSRHRGRSTRPLSVSGDTHRLPAAPLQGAPLAGANGTISTAQPNRIRQGGGHLET